MELHSTNAVLPATVPTHPRLFRLGDFGLGRVGESGAAMRSGFETLDRELAGGGWAQPGITEILCDHAGVGELSLLMKGLGATAPHPGEAAHLLWVLHNEALIPYIPYAPALAQCGIDLQHVAIVRAKNTDDALWSAEQGLKSCACRAVLLRLNAAWVNPLSLRRLQQAAIAGNSILWLMRPREAARMPSPAATRIVLHPEAAGQLRLELLKRRGLPAGKSIHLVARTLACLAREPRAVRVPAKTPTLGWLDQVLGSGISADQENPATVRERSFSRERG
jgi:cell division inhibitor SulA/protein ImuA